MAKRKSRKLRLGKAMSGIKKGAGVRTFAETNQIARRVQAANDRFVKATGIKAESYG